MSETQHAVRQAVNLVKREPGLASTTVTNEIVDALAGLIDPQHEGEKPGHSGTDRFIFFKPTTAVDGAKGRYKGKSLSKWIDATSTGDLAVDHLGEVGTTEDVVIWNVPEIAGSSPLVIDQPYLGIYAHLDPDKFPIIIAISAAGSSFLAQYQSMLQMMVTDFQPGADFLTSHSMETI